MPLPHSNTRGLDHKNISIKIIAQKSVNTKTYSPLDMLGGLGQTDNPNPTRHARGLGQTENPKSCSGAESNRTHKPTRKTRDLAQIKNTDVLPENYLDYTMISQVQNKNDVFYGQNSELWAHTDMSCQNSERTPKMSRMTSGVKIAYMFD